MALATAMAGFAAPVPGAARASEWRSVHGGLGRIDVRFFFEPERPGRPAMFLQYVIPPGASEGVHTHGHGRAEGAWDEYYYVASGTARMRIGEEQRAVSAGEAVHTPLGVAHGIENTHADEPLTVFLVAVER